MRLSPVTLPPGRARLLTSPVPSGSPADVMTMGIVAVACLAARGASVPAATITSTLRLTSSAANSGRRSSQFAAYRYSMTTVLRSIQPNWRKPASKAGNPGLLSPAVRKPRRGNLAVCCARAESGHAVTKPTIALMKSRRRIATPRLRTTPTKNANYIRVLLPGEWGSVALRAAANLDRPNVADGSFAIRAGKDRNC